MALAEDWTVGRLCIRLHVLIVGVTGAGKASVLRAISPDWCLYPVRASGPVGDRPKAPDQPDPHPLPGELRLHQCRTGRRVKR